MENESQRFQAAKSYEEQLFRKFYLWLEEAMPSAFFREADPEWLPLIVHHLMSFKMQEFFSDIHLKNFAIALCIDTPEADSRILMNYPFYGIKSYTTFVSKIPLPDLESFLRIAWIDFTLPVESVLPKENYLELKTLLRKKHPEWNEAKIDALFAEQENGFLRKLPLETACIALEMCERAQTRDHCQYEVQYEENWQEKQQPSMRLVLAWKNTPKHNFLFRIAQVVYRHKLVMQRVVASYIRPYEVDSIFLLSFGLHGANKKAAWKVTDIADFLQELVSIKYFGSADSIYHALVQTNLISGNQANFLRSAAHFAHQILANIDREYYDLENVMEAFCRHAELTLLLKDAFEAKFKPKKEFAQYESIREQLLSMIHALDTGHEYLDNRRKNVFLQASNFVHFTLKTNFFCTNKISLGFRLDPQFLHHVPFDREKIFPEMPYGIFFIKGMHYVGFHLRFRDLARGGLRTIYPKKREKAIAERHTVFLECYNLAYTQQKKNKDIPEGGAKCAIFLLPFAELDLEIEILLQELQRNQVEEREIARLCALFSEQQEREYLYQTQRSFIDTLLTLVNCHDNGELKAKNIIDYYQRPEYIYLGPDENMFNSMIEWIAEKSKKEGYCLKGAFISGKPSSGINHKEYGVTSATVNVFMHEVLKYLSIDPEKEVFTVKMTGGPDGDVAGNEILNLQRFYPNTAKLIALTDVSGTIFDPEGLDLDILSELFHSNRSISHYDPKKLHEDGFLLNLSEKRDLTPFTQQTLLWNKKKGELQRNWLSGNEMNLLYRNHVHHTVADIFIPCGGRPRTLRDTNYQEFLVQGQPTAKAIIEGANLYLTSMARQALEQLGCLIVKDSSANKGGVICSSFEVLAGLILDDQEFLLEKPALIQEILERLKKVSHQEIALMLHALGNKVMLTESSDLISKRINFFTDQLLHYLENISLEKQPDLTKIFLSYCPKVLRKYDERLLTRVPDAHKKAIIASHIASTLVYQKGLNWFPTIVDILPLLLKEDLFSINT